MSFNYTDPSASPVCEVRFVVGDTVEKKHFLEDEEIAFLLKRNAGNVGITAIRACEAICARLSRMRDETVGSVSLSLSQMYANYQNTLSMLRSQYQEQGGIVPYAGGISLSDKQLQRSDRDWNRPHFENDMFQTWAGPFATPNRSGLYANPNLDY